MKLHCLSLSVVIIPTVSFSHHQQKVPNSKMMTGLEAGQLGVRNPRKLTREQVLETLGSDSVDNINIPHSNDDSGTSFDQELAHISF